MRRTPEYITEDTDEIKRLIRENPWATIVANTAQGLVASHYPMLLEEGEGISLVSHVGRPDDLLLELGSGEVLIIIQGPHGYISHGWYDENPAVPTWNHVTAHLYGTPEILSDEENWRVLGDLVHHFEHRMPHPRLLEHDEEYARKLMKGTVGFRVRVTRTDARLKLSQNRRGAIAENIIAELDHGANYTHPELAAEMRRVHPLEGTGVILSNARVGDDLVDVAIEGGSIAQIVPAGFGAASVAAASGSSATGAAAEASGRIDLDGRWLLPGLWDHHVHFNQQALALRRVDVSLAGSAAEAAHAMAAALATRPERGLPLVGHGFRDGLWPDLPHRRLLDDAVGDVPTVLISGDLHTAWLNSAALAKFGHGGHPTGVLVEDDCFAVTGALQHVPHDTLDAWVSDAADVAAARGVVGVVDLEMASNIDNWVRRFAGGFRTLRVQAGIYRQFLDDAIAAGYRTGDVLDEHGMLTVGPFKVLTDGSLNTRTAYCVDAYPGTDERGLLTVAPDELVELLRTVNAAGIAPTVHAIGDEATRLALDSLETVGGGRMEHAQLVRDEDFARFAPLGVAVSVQPEHAMDDRDVADRYWAGRTGRAFALRSLFDAGAELLLGSDAPVSPLDPWRTLSAAVTRARGGREPWHPEQALPVDAALAASTHSRVEAGEVADLVAVDLDPREPANLLDMPVALTIAAGRITHPSPFIIQDFG